MSRVCAGADLGLVAQGRGAEIATKRGGFAGLVTRRVAKPLIDAVNGPALAGGFEIMLACDMVVASEDSIFGIPEVKRGLFAAAGGLIRLPKRIPRAVATEMALTGDAIDAATAAEWGLINRAVPDAELDAAVHDLLTRATRGSVASKALGKQGFYAQVGLDQRAAYAEAVHLMSSAATSPDAQEGIAAFLEKRKPAFTEQPAGRELQ